MDHNTDADASSSGRVGGKFTGGLASLESWPNYNSAENLVFNYGFFRPNPLACGVREQNARHGSYFTGRGSPEQAEQTHIDWIRRFILILYHGKPAANVPRPMWQNRPNASRLIPEVARCGVSLCRA